MNDKGNQWEWVGFINVILDVFLWFLLDSCFLKIIWLPGDVVVGPGSVLFAKQQKVNSESQSCENDSHSLSAQTNRS